MRAVTLMIPLLPSLALAAPIAVHHQGRLLDAAGGPINGPHELEVSLHTARTGGSVVYAGLFEVALRDGFYAVVLGDGPDDPLDSDALVGEIWVQVAVDGSPLGGRTPLLTVPRAARATAADHADTAGRAEEADIADWAVNADFADVATSVSGGSVNTTGVTVSGSGLVVLGQDTTDSCSAQGAIAFDPVGKRLKLCIDGRWAAVAGVQSIKQVGGVRRWTDDSVATSCNAYRNPTDGLYLYAGATGDGVYEIDPDGEIGPIAPYPVVCDQTFDGGGWTLLMRAAGTDFPFESTHWTTASTLNPTNLGTAHGVSAKYASFNQVPVRQLLLRAESGNHTRLDLPRTGTLLSFTQTDSTTTLLTHVSGSDEPGKLINNKDWAYCGHVWRINTFTSAARIRLGGWVTSYWGCGYGNDNAAQPTGAHLLGFGLTDNQWSPFTYNRKSFGIRDAHDENRLNPGQLASSGQIWGR